MDNQFWLGVTVILISGAMNAAFALPMKYSRSWKWENQWLVFSVAGILMVPWALAFALVPGLTGVYAEVTPRALVLPVVLGLLWGCAQVTFGVSLRMVGVALTFAVVSGLASLSGSLIPLLVFHPADLFRPRGLMLLLSIPFLLVGLIFYGVAGRRREKEHNGFDPSVLKITPSAMFTTGLAICIFTGVFGSSINLGFAFSGDILRTGLKLGGSPITSTYPVWVLVLGAGFIPNLLYCLSRLSRNHTSFLFFQSGCLKDAMLALAMATVWITGIVGYGVGATLLGKYGTSIGFTVLTASQILSANTLGMLTGEWKHTSAETKQLLAMGTAVILFSVVVLNLGGLV